MMKKLEDFLLLLLVSSVQSSFPYDILRNHTIHADVRSYEDLNVTHCDQCLCYQIGKTDLVLFTCEQNFPPSFRCRFYNETPFKDDFIHPTIPTDVYFLKNITFRQRDDCCNTTFLIEKLQNASIQTNSAVGSLRFLVRVDDQFLLSSGRPVRKIDSPVRKIDSKTLNYTVIKSGSFGSVGYHDGKYYLGTGNTIEVYDQTLTSTLSSFTTNGVVTPIRFLANETMLVGTDGGKVYIFNKDKNGTFFKTSADQIIEYKIKQVHGIAVVNQTAFYVGADGTSNNLTRYVKNATGYWSASGAIVMGTAISDLVMDNCQRLWAIQARNKTIHIYDFIRNENKTFTLDNILGQIFNLVILNDYTLVISHESSSPGLSRVQPSLNCRRIP